MTQQHPTAIRNTDLPPHFRQIRLELAREAGHPEGAANIAYVIVAPLDAQDRIDAALWKSHREACRVARQRPGAPDQHGHLVHRPGGSWAFRYDGDPASDEVGHHFGDERFVTGEYVSLREDGAMHTFRVVGVQRL
jgi:hypothetical protein